MSEQAMDPSEAMENAHHGSHTTDPFTIRASLSIAVMAVIAATIGGLESSASNEAVLSKNEATLSQNKASDTWAFYQATSIKKNLYFFAADTSPPDKAAGYLKKAKDYETREPGIEKEARGLEAQVEGFSHESDHHTRVHHGLTIAGTIEHVSIAIASIAVIACVLWTRAAMRRRGTCTFSASSSGERPTERRKRLRMSPGVMRNAQGRASISRHLQFPTKLHHPSATDSRSGRHPH